MTVSRDRVAALAAAIVPMATTVAATPLLTRALGPAGYGLLALATTIVTTIPLVDFGVGSSVLRFFMLAHVEEGNAGTGRQLRGVLVFYLVMMALVGVLLVALFSPLSRSLHSRASVSPVVYFALVWSLSLVSCVSNVLLTRLRAIGSYGAAFRDIFFSQSLYIVGILTLFTQGSLTLQNALATQLVQFLFVAGLSLFRVGRDLLGTLPAREEVSAFRRFSARVWGVNLSTAAVLNLPMFLVASLLSAKETGIYALAAMIALALRNLPLVTVSPVMNRIAGQGVDMLESSRQEHKKWLRSICAYSVISVPAIVVAAPILGGGRFSSAVGPAIILFLGYSLSLSTAVATGSLRLLNRLGIELKSNAAAAVVMVVLAWPSIHFFGMYGPGVALLLSQGLCAGLINTQFRRIQRGGAHCMTVISHPTRSA